MSRELAERLAGGMEALAARQLPSGEIPSFRRDGDGRWRYRLDLLASTLAHDALSCFDPYSPWGESQTIDLVDAAARSRFLARVASVRRSIRGFVAWHEEARGGWCAAGRGGGGLDAAATAAAAVVLLEAAPRSRHQPWRRHLRAVAPCRTELESHDPLTLAHVARLLALVGEEVEPILEALLRAIEGEETAGNGEPEGPLLLYHAVARLFRHGLLPGRRAMAAVLAPLVLARLEGAGALGTSLALAALLDLGFSGGELTVAGRALCLELERPAADRGWDRTAGSRISPGLTLALAMSSLARWAVAGGPTA